LRIENLLKAGMSSLKKGLVPVYEEVEL